MTALEEIKKALAAAEQFIVNGVELGYIRMPNPETPDSAHDTLPMIRQAQSALESLQRENEEMKSELAHEASHRQKLQNALSYWMPGVTEEIEISTNGRCGDDALLLVGSDGPFEDKCWGNEAIARAEAAEAEVKRLEAELALSKPVYSRRQLEDRVKTLEKALKPFADVAQYYDPPEKDENQKLWGIATMPTIGNVRDARIALASTGGEHHGN